MAGTRKAIMTDPWAGYLEARASDDPVKLDLELTCTVCGEVLCDIEHGDVLSILISLGREHMTTHPVPD